jgi:hypothetical protein
MPHFGEMWQVLCAMKRRYHPCCSILTPSYGMFGSNRRVRGQASVHRHRATSSLLAMVRYGAVPQME